MNFLDILPTDCTSGVPRYRVIPFGLERTVSFGGGTRLGPEAILRASHEVETFDIEYMCEIYREYGIETLELPEIQEDHQCAIEQLSDLVTAALLEEKIPFVLGGEHSLTPGSVAAVAKYTSDDVTILQFDAHCDLRDQYLDDKNSHACAMRRCLEVKGVAELIGLGIRNMSADEYMFAKSDDRITHFTSFETKQPFFQSILRKRLMDRKIYITFDVDCLDPSIMPATGTPEPGGMSWELALDVLRIAGAVGTVVGFDVVEHAPIKGMIAPNFTTAKLIYKMLSYAHSPSQTATME